MHALPFFCTRQLLQQYVLLGFERNTLRVWIERCFGFTDQCVELVHAVALGGGRLENGPLLVDLLQILLKRDLQFLCVLLDGVHEGLGLFGFQCAHHFLLSPVDLGLIADVHLVFDDLSRCKRQNVGVFLPGLEDRYQTAYLFFKSFLTVLAQFQCFHLFLQFLLQLVFNFCLLPCSLPAGPEPLYLNLVSLLQFLDWIVLVLCNFGPEGEVEWYKVLIFFAYDIFVARDSMQFVEVTHFVGECFCEEFVVVFRTGDVFWEDGFLCESAFYVLAVEPIVLAFVLHDFEDAAAVDSAHVFVVQVFVESVVELSVGLAPSGLGLLESVGVGEDLFAEGAFVVVVSATHGFLVFLQVSVLDLLHVLHGLQVHLLPRLSQVALVASKRTVVLSHYPCFPQMVAGTCHEQLHHHNYSFIVKPNTQSSTDQRQQYCKSQEACAEDLEEFVKGGWYGCFGHAWVQCESEEQTVAETEEVYEGGLGESEYHDEYEEGHEEGHDELCFIDLSQVVAVEYQCCELYADVGAEDAAEAEYFSAHGGYCHAVGCESCDDGNGGCQPPAVLQFVDDEDGEDEVGDEVSVAVMEEHAGEQLVEVGFIRAQELDVEQPAVHLVGVLQKLVVTPGDVEDVFDYEDDEAGAEEDGGDGDELEVGADAVADQVEQTMVRFHDIGVVVHERDPYFAHLYYYPFNQNYD